MIKIKVSFKNVKEKEKILDNLSKDFKVLKVSKEYVKEGQYKRIHIDLQ